MNTFFLKIVLSLSLLTGSVNALLITPKARDLDARVIKAKAEYEAACLAKILMIQLADLSADEIDELPIADQPDHQFSKARLPSPLISLIGQYVVDKDINDIKLPPPVAIPDIATPEAAVVRAPAIQVPIPVNRETNLKGIKATKAKAMLNVAVARRKRKKYHENINAKKRQYCNDYNRIELQLLLENRSVQQHFISFFMGLWHIMFKIDFFPFLSKYPQLRERLKTASVGAAQTMLPSLCYTLYQAILSPIFNTSPINYKNCIPNKELINPLLMAANYILLDLAHKYGSDVLGTKIDLKKYDNDLRTHLTDPDIDIDYDSVKNKLGWLIKTIIAGRLASTCV